MPVFCLHKLKNASWALFFDHCARQL